MTTTAWAHLPNAPLIDALIEALRTSEAARIAARDVTRDVTRDAARTAAWDAVWDAAVDVTRNAARNAAWAAARNAPWGAYLPVSALVAWDDMPAFIALSDTELEALLTVADGTGTAHKALAALDYNTIMRAKDQP